MINKFKKICTKIGISTKPWCGAIVRLWVAFREGAIIKLLIKIFEGLTNKLKQICKWIFCDGQFKSIVASVVIFIIVYISVNWWFVSDTGRDMYMVELVRNGLFGVGALIGLWIAYQRSDAMQKQAKADNEQAKAANEQAKIANRQANLAEKRYASEQFSQSATLLAKDNQNGTPVIEVRIGGIYMLATLAESDPRQYGAEVMRALVIYIRNNAQRTALSSEKDRNKSTPIPEELSAPYPEERLDAAHLGADVKAAFAKLKRLHSNEKVRKDSGVKDEDISFSYADFRALRLNEIEWIEKPDLSHTDLSYTHLFRVNLQGADLSYANLQIAHLWESNLQGANLSWAKLKDARLRKAKLQGANLRWAKLQKTNLRWAELQGANLESSYLNNTSSQRAKLQGANLRYADLREGGLGSANLQGACLKNADLGDAKLYLTNLQGADFRQAILQNTDFAMAIAIYTTFEDADLSYVPTEDVIKTSFNLNKPGIQVSDETVQEWKAWFSDNEFLPNGKKPPSLPLDTEWNLDLIFPEKIEPSDIAFTLEGILRNFAEKGNNTPGPRAIECRKAVKQWVEEHNLWEHLSDDWRDWLKTLDNNYHTQ